MTRTKKTWIAAIVGLTLLLGGAGIVLAQTPGASPSGPTFLDRVAQKLGIETPKLKDAIKSAGGDQLDESVKNGDLTQKQADKIRQRLNDQTDNGQFGLAPRGMGPGRGFPGKGFGGPFGMGLAAGGQKLADFLGIPISQLKTELSANGATLATVAQAHGKSRDQLKQFITDQAKTQLDQAVKDQDITQKQEDNVLSTLGSHLDQMIDGSFFGHRGFRGFGKGNGTPPQTPDGSNSPQPQGGGAFGGFGAQRG